MNNHFEYPFWVKIGIWGCGSRKTLQFFMWISLSLALIGILSIVWDSAKRTKPMDTNVFILTTLCLIASLHYFVSRRWVDRHGQWENIKMHWASGPQMLLGVILIFAVYATTVLGISLFWNEYL